MAEAAKVVQIEDEKQLAVFNNALTTFDVTEKVLKDLEGSTGLEIKDTESEKIVRKFRQTAKSLKVNIDKRRRKLNREYKEKTDEAANILLDRVNPVYAALDTKVKVIEAEKAAKKAEKERIEKERLEHLAKLMDLLSMDCNSGLRYDRSAKDIQLDLDFLKKVTISFLDYQERTEEAEVMLAKGIADTERALENRIKYETEQAEAARIKAEQEAEAKRLAEEKAKLEAERKAQEEEARKKAEAEAEKRRQEEKKLKAEREALEKEKAEIEAKKRAEEEAKQLAIQIEKDHAAALIENEEFHRAKKEKFKADAERAKLVKLDKKSLEKISHDLDVALAGWECPKFNTDEAKNLTLECIAGLRSEIHKLEIGAQELA